MENKEGARIRKKTYGAFLIMLIMLIPISVALIYAGRYFAQQRESTQEQIKADALANIVKNADTEISLARQKFDENLGRDVDLMTSILQEYVTNGKYTGPRTFADGFVAELKNGEVVIPAEIRTGRLGQTELTPERIEKSLAAGAMRSAYVKPAQEPAEAEGNLGEDGYYLSFGEVTEGIIYVHMTPVREYQAYLRLYVSGSLSALRNMARILEVATFVVREDSGVMEQAARYDDLRDIADLSDLAISPEQIRSGKPFGLAVGEQQYRCISTKANGQLIGADAMYILQVIPIYSLQGQSIKQAFITCLLMLLIFVTVIVYASAEQLYVMEHVLNKEEEERYNPTKLRRRVVCAGVAGAVAILLISFVTQAVGQMRQQVRYGSDMLQIMSGQLEQSVQEQQLRLKEEQESWYVRYGERIVSFMEEAPEKVTVEKLRDFREILQADFIMLFDSAGKEYLCSNSYSGFSIDKGLGENSSDFRRLLMGISAIVHDVSVDSTTGLERQMIGLSMAAPDAPGKHGAMIMALLPEQTSVLDYTDNINTEMALINTEETISFSADKATGKILYAGDPTMVGKSVTDYGLSEKSLKGGILDFYTIAGIRRFVVTQAYGDSILYYAAAFRGLLQEDLLYGLLALLLYIPAIILLSVFLLRHYDAAFYEEWSVKLGLPQGEKALENTKIAKSEKDKRQFLGRIFEWDDRLPEEKAGLVFHILLFILLQTWTMGILGGRLVAGNDDSLLAYLLGGDWVKGINLFAFFSILMVAAIANLIETSAQWFLELLSGFLSIKGQTVCVLLQSVIKTAAAVIVALLALYYLGILNAGVIATMGLSSVALSLGAKDMIADIFSGLTIVFEETIRVGDIVEYNGVTGTVKSVGTFSVTLEIPVGKILIVHNHEIGSITNLSKKQTVFSLDLKISAEHSLQEIEEMLARELPEIGKRCKEIIGVPRYVGVTDLGGSIGSEHAGVGHGAGENGGSGMGGFTGHTKSVPAMKISIEADCEEKDRSTVGLFLRREIHLLFKREGIEIY